MDLGDFAPLLAALALAWKLVDFLKYVRTKDSNAALTQLAVWVAGVGVIFLLGATDFAPNVNIGGMALDSVNFWSKVLIGVSIGSSGSVLFDAKKAVDRTDSAKTPALFNDSSAPIQ